MRFLVSGLFFLSLLVSANAQRTFTNKDGVEIEARIVKVTEGRVVLHVPANNRDFNVEIASLSEDDQAYVLQWKEDNPDLQIRLRGSKQREGSDYQPPKDPRSQSSGSSRSSDGPYGRMQSLAERDIEYKYWEIEVSNASRDPVEEVSLSYTFSLSIRGDGRPEVRSLPGGTIAVGEIGPIDSTTVRTGALAVQTGQIVTVVRYEDGSTDNDYERYREDLVGVEVKVLHKGKVVDYIVLGGAGRAF